MVRAKERPSPDAVSPAQWLRDTSPVAYVTAHLTTGIGPTNNGAATAESASGLLAGYGRRFHSRRSNHHKDGPLTPASLLTDSDFGVTRRDRKPHPIADKASIILNRTRRRMGRETIPQFLGNRPADAYRLPQERARMQPELDRRREQYYTSEGGDKQLNLDHADFAEVKRYGNEALNGPLRVRARERNAQEPILLAMADMTLPELVAYTREHRPFRMNDAQEYLLPQDYVKATAGKDQWGDPLFYHDAPVLVEGVLASDIPDKLDLAKGIVADLIFQMYLFKGMIPNGSSRQLDGRSQPPSLTRMGWRIYHEMMDTPGVNPEEARAWLGTVMAAAEIEFFNYWKNDTDFHHTVDGLKVVTPGALDTRSHDMIMREKGNDSDPADLDRAGDLLDPKINGELIRYAWDIASYKRSVGDEDTAKIWQDMGDEMAEQMPLMYDGEIYRGRDVREDVGYFNPVASLNGFMPMANFVIPEEHAETMVRYLDIFTGPYGVAHDVPDTVPRRPSNRLLRRFPRGLRPTIKNHYRDHQWGGSNEPGREKGITEWAIETHGLIKGLTRYGYVDKAIEVAEQWLLGYTEYFNQHGTLPEKRNVLTGANGHGVEYPQQTDFGWSIANYLWVLKQLPELYEIRKEMKTRDSAPLAQAADVYTA